MLEKDMYKYVKDYFENIGYIVKAEILSCDVVCMKDDNYIAVEMKKSLSIKLLSQAAERQKSFDNVYIAIIKPSYKRRFSREYKKLLHLIKRLELGLLYVDFSGEGVCTLEFPPSYFDRNRSIASSGAKRIRIGSKEEFLARSDDYNTGGVIRETRITAYRENALLIALYIERDGAMSAKELKQRECGEKAYNIIYNNHYGWFIKTAPGIYDLTDSGKKAIKKYSNVADNLTKKMITTDDI